MAYVFGLPPAYEIMANFSGLHMDLWGELEMVGTLMDQDVEMVPCESIDLTVPANAEIVVEATVDLQSRTDIGIGVGPSVYYLPKQQTLPTGSTAIIRPRPTPIIRPCRASAMRRCSTTALPRSASKSTTCASRPGAPRSLASCRSRRRAKGSSMTP